ncbi:uncharacterized protein LOC133298985 [Gastrolobium bilobum]|uniref:uncharacterized protein LOC133298985 n=1 Tax=Gastrolobium bilobum TaxID=150636 RepID=UPI002AB2CAA3|nr:uncharacterized protein LOC133298985 [Gastrolobium bilobum]
MKDFVDSIIKVGDGQVGIDTNDVARVEIPEDLLILDSTKPLASIVQFTYPNLLQKMKDFKFFEERAILAPTFEVVEMVNEFILSQVTGEEKEYSSSDLYCIADEDIGIEPDWFTTEFLNEIKYSGFPNHKITLKKEFSLCF